MAGEENSGLKPSEIVKKILTVGVGAVFLTEESLRTLISEVKLPKELIKGVLDSASKSRREFVQSFTREVVDRVMDKVDPKELLDEVISKHEFHVTVKVEPKQASRKDK